jgi:serine phosphatase RsbU (regulator of sigma subunit)
VYARRKKRVKRLILSLSMNRLTVLELLPLAIAAAVSLWWVRNIRRDESRAYWRAVPLWRLKYLIAAQLLTGASVAFFFDLLRGGTADREEVVLLAVIAASVLTALFLLRTRGTPRVARGVTIGTAVIALIVFRAAAPALARLSTAPVSAFGIRFDGAAMLLMMAFGVQAYRTHISTEGARQLRAEAELALAHRLQRVLVPPVVFRNSRVEICGRSIPSDQVGGDLVDVVASEDGVLAYLVDVSGHGIPAGTLMGAAKAAMRCAASRGLGEALETVNRVLPSVKEPAMYATLAAIRFGSADPDAEYTLAGHLPILHYRAAAGTIEPLTLQQFPLGFFDDSRYETRRIGCAPGDMFALFSDGIVETANAKDDQFGVDRVAAQLAASPSKPLEEILEGVLAAAAAHGASDDDRSILVIRVL